MDLPFVPTPQVRIELPKLSAEPEVRAEIRRIGKKRDVPFDIDCRSVAFDVDAQVLRIRQAHAHASPLEVREAAFLYWHLFGFESMQTATELALYRAIAAVDLSAIIGLLWEQQDDLHWIDCVGPRALWAAAGIGCRPMVDALLEGGADPALPTRAGETALMAAIRGGYTQLVRFLLGQRVNVNAATVLGDEPGWTALHCAAAHGDPDTVRLLLAAGAAVAAPSGRGRSPLVVAVERFHLECARLLLAAGADVNRKFYDGRTPLQIAAVGPVTGAVDPYIAPARVLIALLLAHGADTTVFGETAASFADKADRTEGLTELRGHCAAPRSAAGTPPEETA